jgi:hypoxanthine phosphoribosyltransferase
LKTLITEDQLRHGVDRLALEIREHYADRSLTIVGVLIGSMVFLADLMRRIDLPLRLELVQARSYRGASTQPGPLTVNLEMLSADIRGRHVLLVDDIFDTGNTLWELIPQLEELRPASIRSAVLLCKADRCEVPMKPDYVAFHIPNEFVVGYGLDYRDMYRNLPHVAVIEACDIEAAHNEQIGIGDWGLGIRTNGAAKQRHDANPQSLSPNPYTAVENKAELG